MTSTKSIAITTVLAGFSLASYEGTQFGCSLYKGGEDKAPERHLNYTYYAHTTGCRSLGTSGYARVEYDHTKMKIEWYKDWGCAGDVEYTSDKSYDLPKDNKYTSCKVVPIEKEKYPTKECSGKKEPEPPHYEEEKPAPPADNTTYPDTHPPAPDNGGSHPPAANTTSNMRAAVLYTEKDYKGMKRWIDGVPGDQYNDCRGISGDPVAAVKLISRPGADPDADPGALDDDVSLVFYDSCDCKGKVVGVVTGQNPNVCGSFGQGDGGSDYEPVPVPTSTPAPALYKRSYEDEEDADPHGKPEEQQTYPDTKQAAPSGGDSCSGGVTLGNDKCIRALSVRFVKAGTPSKEYGGLSTDDNGAAGSTASGLLAAAAAGLVYIFK